MCLFYVTRQDQSNIFQFVTHSVYGAFFFGEGTCHHCTVHRLMQVSTREIIVLLILMLLFCDNTNEV